MVTRRAGRIVGILVAAGQTVNTLSHQLGQLMIDLASLAGIIQTRAQALDQTIAKAPIGG
jgi:ABC-type transporter Mla subunit MlaD